MPAQAADLVRRRVSVIAATSTPAIPVAKAATSTIPIVFTTGAGTVKGRNLQRTRRAAICVDDDRPPFSFVTLEGPVTIDDDLARVRAWATRLGRRYMGASRAEEYGARNGVPGELLVRLHPERTSSAADLAN